MSRRVFSNWIMSQARELLDALPVDCSLCGQLSRGDSLCDRCIASLPRQRQPCLRCGLELPRQGGLATTTEHCAYCAVHSPAIDRCIALLRYGSPVDRLVSGFKYHARFADGRTLTKLLAERINSAVAGSDLPELLIPVPQHPARWRERGFNQAKEIGDLLSSRFNIPLAARLVIRRKATETQTALPSAAARRRNLAGAFSISSPAELAGRQHVAIVDDVITTLSTVNALASCLRRGGVARIDCWCLARAER